MFWPLLTRLRRRRCGPRTLSAVAPGPQRSDVINSLNGKQLANLLEADLRYCHVFGSITAGKA
jgi:hypothetical protein